MLLKDGGAAFLLLGIAKDAHEDNGGFQVAGDIDVVDSDKAGFGDGQLLPNGFADGALQKFAHALES
jgi:hypothetical protein